MPANEFSTLHNHWSRAGALMIDVGKYFARTGSVTLWFSGVPNILCRVSGEFAPRLMTGDA